MKHHETAPAVHLTQAWVRLYTAGLAPDARAARQAEVDSDLWEHTNETSHSGWHVAARLLFGVPADVTWRLDQRDAGEPEKRKEKGVIATTTERAFIGGAWLMAAFTVTIALIVAFGGGESDVAGVGIARPLWAVIGIVIGALIIGGVWSSDRTPVLGGGLVLVGGLPLAVMLSWSVLVPAFWLLLAILLILRALQTGRGGNHGAPA